MSVWSQVPPGECIWRLPRVRQGIPGSHRVIPCWGAGVTGPALAGLQTSPYRHQVGAVVVSWGDGAGPSPPALCKLLRVRSAVLRVRKVVVVGRGGRGLLGVSSEHAAPKRWRPSSSATTGIPQRSRRHLSSTRIFSCNSMRTDPVARQGTEGHQGPASDAAAGRDAQVEGVPSRGWAVCILPTGSRYGGCGRGHCPSLRPACACTALRSRTGGHPSSSPP